MNDVTFLCHQDLRARLETTYRRNISLTGFCFWHVGRKIILGTRAFVPGIIIIIVNATIGIRMCVERCSSPRLMPNYLPLLKSNRLVPISSAFARLADISVVFTTFLRRFLKNGNFELSWSFSGTEGSKMYHRWYRKTLNASFCPGILVREAKVFEEYLVLFLCLFSVRCLPSLLRAHVLNFYLKITCYVCAYLRRSRIPSWSKLSAGGLFFNKMRIEI